jgi:hypothetical protein
MLSRTRRALFPDPPRHIPAQRAIGIGLRTGHLLTFGTLLGGHLFGIDAERLRPFLFATIASGAGLIALELASTFDWLFTGKGVIVLLKLILLVSIPFFWEHRVLLLYLVVVVASIGAHMPARFRHYSLLTGRAAVEEMRRQRI